MKAYHCEDSTDFIDHMFYVSCSIMFRIYLIDSNMPSKILTQALTGWYVQSTVSSTLPTRNVIHPLISQSRCLA